MKIDSKVKAEASGADHDAAAPQSCRQDMPAMPMPTVRSTGAKGLAQRTAPARAGMPQPSPLSMPSPPDAAAPRQAAGAASKAWRNPSFRADGENILLLQETPADQRTAGQRAINLARYFTDTWPSVAAGSHERQLASGQYLLCRQHAQKRPFASHAEFVQFVRGAGAGFLPDFILHVAGPPLHNFLCHTFLYNPSLALFEPADGRRVEPVPDLKTVFELRRDEDGSIAVDYAAGDNRVDSVMLLGQCDHDEHEVRPASPGSISFTGTLRFFADGRFTAGPVQVRAGGLGRFAPLPAGSA